MKIILQQQMLAALVAAPANITRTAVTKLEPEDFGDWQYRTIFNALLRCELADHPEPGSCIIQINKHLLEEGHYTDTDNGLRATVTDLAGIIGHPEQITGFITELIEQRFRRAVGDFALAVAEHATTFPLADVDASLARIDELRRLRSRIPNHTVRIVMKGAA